MLDESADQVTRLFSLSRDKQFLNNRLLLLGRTIPFGVRDAKKGVVNALNEEWWMRDERADGGFCLKRYITRIPVRVVSVKSRISPVLT